MSGLSDLPNIVESVVFIAALLALIYVIITALEAAPINFDSEIDDAIEDGYDALAGGWENA